MRGPQGARSQRGGARTGVHGRRRRRRADTGQEKAGVAALTSSGAMSRLSGMQCDVMTRGPCAKKT